MGSPIKGKIDALGSSFAPDWIGTGEDDPRWPDRDGDKSANCKIGRATSLWEAESECDMD